MHWATTSLKAQPGNIAMLQVKALCLKNGNNPIGAIDAYTELLRVKPSALVAYELMELQYSVQRLLECAAIGQQVLWQIHIDSNALVQYTLDGKTTMQTQLKAAIYNVYGLALSDLKRLTDAEAAFEQALLVDKNYALAQKNLATLKELKRIFQQHDKS